MKLITKLLIIGLLVVTVSLVSVLPAAAQPNLSTACINLGGGVFEWQFTSSGDMTWDGNAVIPGFGPLLLSMPPGSILTASGLPNGSRVQLIGTGLSTGINASLVCPRPQQPATVPVVCTPLHGGVNECVDGVTLPPVIIQGGSINFFFIDPVTGSGSAVTTITDEQIVAIEDAASFDVNVTLFETTNPFTGQPFVLSELTTGEFQVNTFYADGKAYIFVWGGGRGPYHIAA